MEKHECLEQLTALIEHCESMSEEDGDIWDRDIDALQMALQSVAGVDMDRWNERIFETGIKGTASSLKTAEMMTDCTVEITKKIMAMTDRFGRFSGVCLVAALRKVESLVLDALATEGDTKEEITGAADDICGFFECGFMVTRRGAKL